MTKALSFLLVTKRVKLLNLYALSYFDYIKYFENGGKNMSFLIKDDEVWEKCKKLWDVIKNKLSIKFHSKPIYNQKYLEAKVREFDGVIKKTFWVMICQKEICIILALLA